MQRGVGAVLCILVRLDLLYLGIASIVGACILMYFGNTGIWICLHLETAGVVGMASVMGIFGFLFMHLGNACVFRFFSVPWLAGVVGILGLCFCMHVYICQRDSSLVGNACVLCIFMLERCCLFARVIAACLMRCVQTQRYCSLSAKVIAARLPEWLWLVRQLECRLTT